jgi:hypothetical protein
MEVLLSRLLVLNSTRWPKAQTVLHLSEPNSPMAVLPTGKGTRGYPTLLGKDTGIEFYPRVRVRV